VARAQKDYGFTAIRVEGGLLPPEYLQTINALNGKKQTSTDYGLTKSLNIKDEIGRYWRMASDRWSDYQERRKRTDMEPSRVAIETWLRPLFEDILGYHDIAPCPSVAIGSRHFPIGYNACASTVPLVLTGHTFDLDRADMRFGDEGRRRPPHGLLQEYLNAADTCLWGMVSNGNLVRLVRDNPSLTRPAFIEADLERIFAEQLFADFAAFWLTLHVSRLAPHDGSSASCILEAWRTESIKTGERARENLRKGVTAALRQLGNGFLEHPANDVLRKALSNGEIMEAGYFQELLRLVYRLLFLFTVEDRDLLFHPEASADAHRLYTEGYSLSRLRDRALKRRHYDQYGDLWEGLRIVFGGLARGMEPLGLPALGGLFVDDQCPHLDACAIANNRLLQAIHSLVFFESGKTLARVNYRDMGTEELGSVYESLLELHPIVSVTPWKFGFIGDDQEGKVNGSERKTTGSYYTQPLLVNELIKSALIPVIEQTLKDNQEQPREALLELNIVDPACGSGHFLLAAARQLAAEIARLDAGLDTPGEALRQHALREIVQHCIYGVDKNPLAVELCKTALWIETVEPGKPLSFLDAHIRSGDSLVGILDPQIMANGIPDEAYKPLTGDKKTVAADLRCRNQQAGQSVQGDLFNQEGLKPIVAASFDFDAMPEDTLEQIDAKRKAWERTQETQALKQQELKADLFVGAFFAPKIQENAEKVPLTEDLNRLAKGLPPRPGLGETVRALAKHYGLFHWPLAFPEVFARGGFDVVLGNPPWERIKLQEQEFFSSRSKEIAEAPNKAAREGLIKALTQPDATPAEKTLHREFEEAKHEAEAASQFVRTGGRYPLTGVGDVNTYAIFAETFMRLISATGRAGLIVPTGIATDDTTKRFFVFITQSKKLRSLLSFYEIRRWFPGTDDRKPFCLLTLGVGAETTIFEFDIHSIEDLSSSEKRFTLSPEDIRLINPNTRTSPIFRSKADAELTKKMYARIPVLIDEAKGPDGNPWGISFMRMFDMSTASGLFRTSAQLEEKGARRNGATWITTDGEIWVSLYEAKMIHQFDHRYGTFEGLSVRPKNTPLVRPTPSHLGDKHYETEPWYWIPQPEVEELLGQRWERRWLMGWRDFTNSAAERTVIATAFPKMGCGDTLLLMFPIVKENKLYAALLANLNALPQDYLARQKIAGTHIKYNSFKQLCILPPETYSQSSLDFIVPRVLELTYNTESMRPFAEDMGYQGPPFAWDTDRRALLRTELDAYYAYLYGLTRDELRYILDPTDVLGSQYPSETFRVLKENELAQFGEYRTQRLVLQAWNRLQADGLFNSAPSPVRPS
jgi:hypothetical protein